MGSDIRSIFTPGIHKYVENLLRQGKIGICAGTLRLLDVNTGCSRKIVAGENSVTDIPNGDRFKIVIPYAGHSITWEVLFNWAQPEEPPDFIFGPDDTDFEPDTEELKSLVNWNASDPLALLNVINELIEEYRKYQKNLLDENSMLKYMYTSLVETNKYREEDIEIYVSRKGQHKVGPVSFLIKLPVDFARIPGYLTKDCPGEDTAVLVVTYPSLEGGKATPQMFLSPRVENSIGGSAGLRIPPLTQGALEDYVPLVCELLDNKVDQVVKGFEKKKEYMGALLSHFGESVLEYDAEGSSRICFLFEWHDFFFQISIETSVTFPADPPTLTFLSVYHVDIDGGPFCQIFRNCPHSPRWSGTEMAERARTFILENISGFQKMSVKEGAINAE